MSMDTKKKNQSEQPDLFSSLLEDEEGTSDEKVSDGDLSTETDDVQSEEALAEEELSEKTEEVEAEEQTLVQTSKTDIVEEALAVTDERDDVLTLAHFASKAYLEYAISVVKGRALPEICDGQKPVQRRILYAMYRMGLRPDAKQVKSARVVGEVLGKFHPHGDTAAYDAMVRMAQDFSMRYPLVDGHGNFGSRDGDGAAAMRYTEAKLTKFSELLLSEIDGGTVNFVPNYDGAFKEPSMLPARMPFVLLNGASGIAVGMATEIPPHNMKEVAKAVAAVLENPQISLEEVLEVMPGPDFPGGSQIISSAEAIREVYRSGNGSLQMRASYHFEELARGQWQMVVTELPYKVSSQKVLAEIEAITNPKPPAGKKTTTAKQNQEKMLMLNVLDKARDESDKEVDVRLVFEPRSKTVDRDEFVNTLFAKTSLECGCKFNVITIGINGKPAQKSLLDILSEWGEFRTKTVRRRSQFRLEAVEDRIHILEGRLKIFVSLDEVIHIIRNAEDPKQELIVRFGLSDRQAEDILEIKLRQLAKLEDIKLEKELKKLQKERDSLKVLLSSETKLRRKVISELLADAEQYGDDRRTLIKEESGATLEKKVLDEPVTVVISEKGFVRSRTGHGIDPEHMNFKLGDKYLTSFECRSIDQLVILSNTGRAYTVPVCELPSARGDGTHISAFVQLGSKEKLVSWFAGKPETKLLVTSDNAMGLTCLAKNLYSKRKAGITFFDVQENAGGVCMQPLSDEKPFIAAISETGRLVIFDAKEVSSRASGGKGVSLMELQLGEKMVRAVPATANGVTVIGQGRGGKIQEMSIGPRLIVDYKCKRARKGKPVPAKWKFIDLKSNDGETKTNAPALVI